MGHRAEQGGLMDPINKSLSARVGGTLELGCNPPRRRTLQNQNKAVAYRGVVWGVQTPHPGNSEDIGGVLDRTSKKNRRLDFCL